MKIAITLDVIRDLKGSFLSVYDKIISPQNDMDEEEFYEPNQRDLSNLPLEEDSLEDNSSEEEFSLEEVDFSKERKILRKIIDIPREYDVAKVSGSVKFESLEEYEKFTFEDNSFEIFGRAEQKYQGSMIDLNELYSILVKLDHRATIVSQEMGNSKSGTLLFLAQNKCMANNYKFVSNYSKMWEEFDAIITANVDIVLSCPINKPCIFIVSENDSDEYGNMDKEIWLKDNIDKFTLKQTIEFFKNS